MNVPTYASTIYSPILTERLILKLATIKTMRRCTSTYPMKPCAAAWESTLMKLLKTQKEKSNDMTTSSKYNRRLLRHIFKREAPSIIGSCGFLNL